MIRTRKNKILALRVALLKAVAAADQHKLDNDEGTCCLDEPFIILKNWSKASIKEAFMLTGLRPDITDKDIVYILNGVNGQGFRRTAMAEAIRDSLRESGYTAHVHYRVD